MDVRVIGVISAEEIEHGEKEINHRLSLSQSTHMSRKAWIQPMTSVKTSLSQLEEFFISYNKRLGDNKRLGEKFRILATYGLDLKASLRKYRQSHSKA